MTTDAIIESGMTFGPYPAGQCFYIEKSACYEKVEEGVQMAEFLLLKQQQQGPTVWVGCSFDWPAWSNNLEYRCVMSDKHPDNSLLDVGDVVKSWYFTAVVAKITNKGDDSEKYFAVITENTGTQGKASGNFIGELLYNEVGSRKHITEYFKDYAVIKKSEK